MEELIKIEVVNGKPCVTSQQVAEAFGKEHKNIMRDIRETIAKCSKSFSALNFELAEYMDEQGKPRPMYLLTKDGLMMVTMGYTTHEAMTIKEAYINRFNEMERQIAEAEKVLLPQTYPEALRALAAEVELKEAEKQQRLLAERQRDEAIRTKAQIGSRREATAMNTASRLSKENAKLIEEYTERGTYMAVTAIPFLNEMFKLSKALYQQVGKKLTALSERMKFPIHTIPDSRYGTVKKYHKDVIEAFRVLLINDPNMLGKYRRAA